MPKPERNSSLEALRLVCMVGIVLGHVINLQNQLVISPLNRAVILFLQGFTNFGVTTFMLISGYFSIRLNTLKAIRLHHTVIFYALLSTAGFLLFGNYKPSAAEVFFAFFPIVGYKYWFISCYFIIMLLSPYINQIAERLPRRQFETLLAILLALFAVVPTIFITGFLGDGGKGVINIFLSYLIGQYLRKYVPGGLNKRHLLYLFAGLYLLTFAANYIANSFFGTQTFFKPYGRDNSVTIIGMAVIALLWVRERHFTSVLLNRIAVSVLPVYLFEEVVRGGMRKVINPDAYVQSPVYGVVAIIYTLLVVAFCLGFDQVRLAVAGRLFNRIAQAEEPFIHKAGNRLQLWLNRLVDNRLS